MWVSFKNKFLLFLIVASPVVAQDLSSWKADEINRASTAVNASYLSENERQVVLFMNLARIDGQKFFDTYFQIFMRRYNQTNKNKRISADNEYLRSLQKDLNTIKNLPPFQVEEGLTKAARYHAKDMGSTGKTGHISSDGMSPSERGEKFAGTPYVGENCSYGHSDALSIVGQLLLDDGVPSLGHRVNILDQEYGYYAVGVAIEPHKEFRYNCVIDFAAKSSMEERNPVLELPDQKTIPPPAGEFPPSEGEAIPFRSKYIYNGGKFIYNAEKRNWKEQTDQGIVNYFKEVSRQNNRVVLFDQLRNVWLRIDWGKNTCEYSSNGTNWALLYYIK